MVDCGCAGVCRRYHVTAAGFYAWCRRGESAHAHAESFFHTLKSELTRGVTFDSEPALRRELQRYIRYDNTVRLHSSLNYRSPLAFERQAA